jgi:ubiquinone/menaquinone biosynthesis C-methylase UbiE
MAREPSDPPSFKDLEQSGWEAKAEAYDRFAGKVTAQATEFLLSAAAVSAGKRVLDVACGPGYGAGGAAARGAVATGVDFAPSMVAVAARKFPDAEFRDGDGERLAFPDASFDAVICPFGLLHMPQPERAVAEAHRVLRTGGRYAFTVWATLKTHQFFAVVTAAVKAHGNLEVPMPSAPSAFRFSDADECKKTLSAAGFRDIDVRSIPLVWRGQSGRECLDLIYNSSMRTAMLLQRQAPEALERIHRAIVEGAERFRKGGGIEMAWPAVLTSATKA